MDKVSYVIEDNIPVYSDIPKSRSALVNTMTVLKVGQSFLCQDKSRLQIGPYIASASRITGAKYSSRTMTDGIRIWRIK